MPPPAVADVAVAQSAEEPAEPLALAPAEEELPAAAAAAVVEELELLQPAASMIEPTAAAVATIAFDARKVKPSHARPQGYRGTSVCILARQVASSPSGLNGR
jgi:hypothetical protein